MNQQQQNNHLRIDSSLSNWHQTFALDSAVVKTQNWLAQMDES